MNRIAAIFLALVLATPAFAQDTTEPVPEVTVPEAPPEVTEPDPETPPEPTEPPLAYPAQLPEYFGICEPLQNEDGTPLIENAGYGQNCTWPADPMPLGWPYQPVDEQPEEPTDPVVTPPPGPKPKPKYKMPNWKDAAHFTGGIRESNAQGARLTGTAKPEMFRGSGWQIMAGGQGDDTYVFDHDRDQVIEAPQGGTDKVSVFARSTLGKPGRFDMPPNVENFESRWPLPHSDLVVVGNALDNKMLGNPHRTVLDGGPGGDYMDGREGTDEYVLRAGEAEGDYLKVQAGEKVFLVGFGKGAKVESFAPTEFTVTYAVDGAERQETFKAEGPGAQAKLFVFADSRAYN